VSVCGGGGGPPPPPLFFFLFFVPPPPPPPPLFPPRPISGPLSTRSALTPLSTCPVSVLLSLSPSFSLPPMRCKEGHIVTRAAEFMCAVVAEGEGGGVRGQMSSAMTVSPECTGRMPFWDDSNVMLRAVTNWLVSESAAAPCLWNRYTSIYVCIFAC